jgi:hypothetical protein
MDGATLAGQSDLLIVIGCALMFALGWLAGSQR